MDHQPLLQKNVNICRTCMSSDTNLTSLFSVLSLANKGEALNSILYKCTSIQVYETDVLPQSICNSCLEKLAICYLYRELCFETQSRLQQLYDSDKQSLSYIDNTTTTESCIGSLESPQVDTKVIDYISYRTVKSQYSTENNIHENTGITTELDVLPGSKPTEQNFKRNENLEQSCDIEYLGCDNQNSYEESDEGKEFNLENNCLDEFKCVICSKKYNSKYSLNRHMKFHSDAEELKCHICMKKFTRAADVKRHLSAHTGEKPYVCDICKCSFTQSGSLAAHMRQKHKNEECNKQLPKTNDPHLEKPYLCSMCGRCFRHSSTLKMHMRRHVGDKPYECQMCNLRFVSSGRLRSHIRVHSGERPFVCHVCNKNFAQSTVLSRHLKAHADVKPHKCSYCPKRFFIPYYLNIHIRQHFEVSLADLQNDNDAERSFRKFRLIAEDVQGRYVLTNFHGMDLTTDKLRSMVKKWQSLIEASADVKTSDGYLLRVFCIGFTQKDTQFSQRKTCYAQHTQIRQIRKKMVDIITRDIQGSDLKEVVNKLLPDSIAKDIEKACQGIYPLHDVFIRKVKVLKKPRYELSKLLELHGDSKGSGEGSGEPGVKVDRLDGYEPPVQESV